MRRREGGIIWHTQGSGKSLTMVWLAKWIGELTGVDGRVLIVTDRKELDEQIENVFMGVNEDIHRTKSGADLADALGDPSKSLICSLVHKFGSSEEGSVEQYVSDLRKHMPRGLRVPGEIFVFVDECHRTQSGKLHGRHEGDTPRGHPDRLHRNTPRPLLKADKQRSNRDLRAVHPHVQVRRGVDDGVVLDLRYEARDIDQDITSEARIDSGSRRRRRG